MAHLMETMAYAGETPWHGLGVQVEDNLTVEEMIEAAGISWGCLLYTSPSPRDS